MASTGLEFEIVIPETEEIAVYGETPRSFAVRMATDKAENVAEKNKSMRSDALILAADTVVEFKSRILAKPRDAADVQSIPLVDGIR